MRKNFLQNLLFAAGVLLLAGVLALLRTRPGIPGAGTSGTGTPGAAARVTVDGSDDILLPLNESGRYSVGGGRLPVTLEISDGRIRFVESQCPDHICEHYGWLSQEYDQAICMPAGVVVTVERQ